MIQSRATGDGSVGDNGVQAREGELGSEILGWGQGISRRGHQTLQVKNHGSAGCCTYCLKHCVASLCIFCSIDALVS